MKIETRDFGALEIDPKEVLSFRTGIFGFDELTEYALLYDDTMDSPFVWLQSTQDKDVCFILVDPPAAGILKYTPRIPAETARQLGLEVGQSPAFFVIAVISEPLENSTVNLKSPIVVNPAARCAAQVILDEEYPIRARLISEKEGGELC